MLFFPARVAATVPHDVSPYQRTTTENGYCLQLDQMLSQMPLESHCLERRGLHCVVSLIRYWVGFLTFCITQYRIQFYSISEIDP